jgi:hypothetical protein
MAMSASAQYTETQILRLKSENNQKISCRESTTTFERFKDSIKKESA